MKGRGDRKALCCGQDALKTLSALTLRPRRGVTMGRDLDNNIPRHPTPLRLLRSICHVNWKTFLRSGRVWTQFYFIFPTFQTPGPGLDFMMRYNGPDPSHKPDIFWL